MKRTDIESLSPENARALRETDLIVRSYLAGLSFIVKDTARDPSFLPNHLLSCLSQDILQSGVSIISLAAEGMLSVAKRELRFLVEASIKICFVQTENYASTIQEKLALFNKELSSQRISVKQRLKLVLLPEALRSAFAEEVGRIYGLTSEYVHLTPTQIVASVEAAEAGVTAGRERPSDIENFNRLAERAMAASMVLLLHSVPSWVSGDWLVEPDGDSIGWHFKASKFIAGMDAEFDYKHERQDRLQKIRNDRAAAIRF